MEKMDYKLLKEISNYLCIQRYVDETEESFINRLLYSAVGESLLVSTLKKNSMQPIKGVSKTYINLRNSKYLESLWMVFPSFRDYFGDTSSSEVIKKMRLDYELAGVLRPSNFGEFVELAPVVFSRIGSNSYYSRNNLSSKKRIASGLGFYEKMEYINQEYVSMEKLFDLNEMNALEWTRKYVRKINWQNAGQLNMDTGIQFYNPKLNKSLSNCWINEFPQNVEITLYKKNDFDYGFAKYLDEKVIGIYIPTFYINASNPSNNMLGGEVRRFMYGLKSIHENKAKALLETQENYTMIKFFSKLPVRESMIMRMCGWPVKNYDNDFEYLVPNDLITVCKQVIENLAIRCEQVGKKGVNYGTVWD